MKRALLWAIGSSVVGAIAGAVCGAYGLGITPILGAAGAAWIWFFLTMGMKGAVR